MYEAKSVEQKRKELNDCSHQLLDGVSRLLNSPNGFQDLLIQVSKNLKSFHPYSIHNTALIFIQKCDASLCASYSDWKNKYNRTVKKGERSLKIFCPVPYKIEVEVEKLDEFGNKYIEKEKQSKIGFRLGNVFDISQTVPIPGKPEVPLSVTKDLTGSIENFDEMLEILRRVSPVDVEFKTLRQDLKGYFSDSENKIVINSMLSEQMIVKTLLHEVAHSYLHSKLDRTSDTKISFYVSESMEFPFSPKFEHYEGLSLPEAIEKYNRMSSDRYNAGKTIGFVIKDGSIYDDMSYPLLVNGKIDMESINLIEHFRENYTIQRAISQLKEHFPDNDVSIRSTREHQAESCAFIISNMLGLDTSEYSFPYIATWQEKPEQLLDNMEVVQACSLEIVQSIERVQKQILREDMGIQNSMDMAERLDRFARDLDWYEYMDSHEYYGLDDLKNDIDKGNISEIENYLHEIIKDDRDPKVTEEAERLMECLRTFAKDLKQTIHQKQGRGMRR